MMNATIMDRVQKKAAGYIGQLCEGRPAVEIAAEMYRQNLPGKSEQTAMMMAQHTRDTVAEYYRSKAAALENYEAWVSEAFAEATKRMDEAEAYNQLYQIYVGAVANAKLKLAATAEEKEAVENWVKEESEHDFAPEEVTPEALEDLKEKLAAALKDTNLLITQLDAMSEMLRNEEADARMVLDFGAINEEVMTLLAMQTYLDVKNGLIDEIPGSARLEEIALGVCSAMDTCRIAAQVASGEMTEEEGEKLLGILGGVFGALLAITSIYYGGLTTAFVVYLMLGSSLIAAAAGVVMTVAISEPVFNGLVEAGETVGNVTQNTVKVIASGVSMLLSAVVKGAKAVWARVCAWENEIKAKAQAEDKAEAVQQATAKRETAEVTV